LKEYKTEGIVPQICIVKLETLTYGNRSHATKQKICEESSLLPGFERTNSTVPHGRLLAEIISTVLRDWHNLRNRSSMKRNIPPAAILKIKSPTCNAKPRTKTTYS
jgi:hypothetical protein